MTVDQAMKVEQKLISEIIPYARNPRKNQEAVAKVAGSLKEFGWKQPIVIDAENVVIAGHTRLMAAQSLGMETVPVLIADDLTENQVKAYRLADNRVSQEAEWDNDLLGLELKDLMNDDFDIGLTGFDAEEIFKLTEEPIEGNTDEDEVPDVPETPKTVEGDIWILGRNKIICGDATDVDCWSKLEIEKGVVVFSSPPYNLGSSIKLSGNKTLNKKSSAYETYSDNVSDIEYIDLLQSSLNAALTFCDVAAFNLQPLANSKRPLMRFLNDNSSNMVDIITWDKGHAAPAMAEGVMSSRYEWIFLFSNQKEASRRIPYASWRGKWSNVYQASSQKDNEFASIHGATFPIHLPLFIVGDLMNRSRGVLDCFCGTGTTIIAAEKLGKIGYGIELDPKYCDVIIKRWQDFTGQKAIHAETGEQFDDIKN